ncbi:MAG: helix-turn-helix domain-containing protein [Eubacterium sp.]|nr:helix-turn-helix domain-containing protein [Eubacterium sp.]
MENNNSGLMTTDNIFTEYADIVSVEDMMKMLCIGRSSAYKLLNSGEIRSIRQGKVHKIPKICIVDYLNRNLK